MSPLVHRAATLAVIGLAAAATPSTAQSAGAVSALTLRPGDAIRVEVRDEPDLEGEYPIDAEGYVLLPGVGRLRLADRPFGAIRSELLEAYALELSEPVVQLTPLLRVAVLGEVRDPGLFMVDPTHDIADVLALAGGLTGTADRSRVSLMREGEAITTGGEIGLDSLAGALRSGDQLLVQRQRWYVENAPILVGAAASMAAAAVTSLIIR